MRGRSAVWYRVRVNLIHVPEDERPGQEPLESDFDPWAGQDIEAWKAATAGSRARRPTPKSEGRQDDGDDDRASPKPASEGPEAEDVEADDADEAEAMIDVVGIDHVQLSMPPGGEAEARAFYVGSSGCARSPKPPELAGRGGCWFVGDGAAIHSAPEIGFRPHAKAHPALVDPGPRRRAREALAPPASADRGGRQPVCRSRRCYIRDPFGNRIELDDERDAGVQRPRLRRDPRPRQPGARGRHHGPRQPVRLERIGVASTGRRSGRRPRPRRGRRRPGRS